MGKVGELLMQQVKVIMLVLFLAGCGAQGVAIRSAISKGGADAADQTLTDVEWYMCYAASIGSIKRRYGRGKASAYNELCRIDSSGIIIDGSAKPLP